MSILIAVMMVGASLSCRSPSSSSYSESEVRTEALRDAATTIAAGKLYVCETGTIGIYLPGVPASKAKLVKDLPRHGLPSGCTNPLALRSITYAEIFNCEIVRYLSEKR